MTNNDLRTVYGIDTSDEWVEQRTGIKERRFADEGVGCSDLALRASEQAIERSGLQKSDIGMIIFCTLSPDQFFPGTGVYLQQKLGLCELGRFIPCMDIRNQCSGFLHGLSTASALVQSGAQKHILLVGAEVHSSALDLTTRGRNTAREVHQQHPALWKHDRRNAPSLLFEAEQTGPLKRGMKVVLVAFGAGFTWGCSVVDW